GATLVAITNDPDEAARAPMGDTIVADVRLTLEALLETIGPADDREAPPERPPPEEVEETHPMNPSTAVRGLASVFSEDGIVAVESPSATPALRNQLRLRRPG